MLFTSLKQILLMIYRHLLWVSVLALLALTAWFSLPAGAQTHTATPTPPADEQIQPGSVNGHEEEIDDLNVESSLEPVETADAGFSLPWMIVITGLLICGIFFFFFLKQVASDHKASPKK